MKMLHLVLVYAIHVRPARFCRPIARPLTWNFDSEGSLGSYVQSSDDVLFKHSSYSHVLTLHFRLI